MMFTVEQVRPSDSPLIEKVWYVQNDQEGEFTSLAEAHSEIVITKYEGDLMVAVRGPESKASPAIVPGDFECFGIVFRLGTFMPTLLPKNLMDRRDVYLPRATQQTLWLDGATWEIPTFENADTFVGRLVREGLLVHDPIITDVLQGQPPAFSPRALQYRFVRATGLPLKVIQQIERAKHAAKLLESGKSILDTVHETGYFDQAHLTNSLKRFIGQTPVQVIRSVTSE